MIYCMSDLYNPTICMMVYIYKKVTISCARIPWWAIKNLALALIPAVGYEVIAIQPGYVIASNRHLIRLRRTGKIKLGVKSL